MNLGEVGDSGSGAGKVLVVNIVDLKTNWKLRLNVVSSPFPSHFHLAVTTATACVKRLEASRKRKILCPRNGSYNALNRLI
jgi:hypothetical protein